MWEEVWQNDCNCEVTQKRLNGKKKYETLQIQWICLAKKTQTQYAITR